LPNIVVEPDGTVSISTVAQHVTLASGKNSLLREQGTALVIHAEADDYRTDPSGNSGDRIACGVITK
jgi:Cu-Zn family superoxide dismutase